MRRGEYSAVLTLGGQRPEVQALLGYFDRWRKQRLAEALGLPRLGSVLGCGAYGCAFDAEQWGVVKVTTDAGEGQTWERLRRAQQAFDLPGLVRIEKVIEVQTSLDTAVYAALREKLYEMYDPSPEEIGAVIAALTEYEYGYEDGLHEAADLVAELGPQWQALAQTLHTLASLDLAPRDLHPYNFGIRDGQVVLFDPGDIYYEGAPEPMAQHTINPSPPGPNARRVTQPEYWSAIVRAALPRTSAMERAALEEIKHFDLFDVLKWAQNLSATGIGAFEFGDWRKSLNFLAIGAVSDDMEFVGRIGRVPSSPPPPTYEVTEDQYWDEVRRALGYALKAVAQYTSTDPDDVNASLAKELWHRIHGHNKAHPHPFVQWPRSLDVLRHSQNLDSTLAQHWDSDSIVGYARADITYDWLQNTNRNRHQAIELLSEVAMWADAVRMGTSQGKYAPNPEEEDKDYWGGDYWIVDIGGDAFDQPTREDAIDAAREMMREESVSRGGAFHKAQAVFVHRGGMGGEEPAFLTWLDLDNGEPRIAETTDPEVMVLVADRLGLRELGMPIPESWPPGMTPNIRPDAYWAGVRQMTVRTHYPVDYVKDMPLAASFVVSYEDALDAMRMSSEPGMIGPWLDKVSAPKPSDEPLLGLLPPDPDADRSVAASDPKPTPKPLTVVELVLTAGRIAALADTDHWAVHKKPYPSPAPPLMSLDDYIAYVRQAALIVARSPDPSTAYLQMLNVEGSMNAHPLIVLPRGDLFPYRSLDVLRHTSHPEALWEDAWRRIGFEQPALYDRTKAKFNEACKYASSEKAFAWLASAALGADILDELSVMGLSKYDPGAVG